MESHTAGSPEVGSLLLNTFGECPESFVELDGVQVRCLLDTGAQVSTMMESFFKQFLVNRGLTDAKSLIRIHLADGQDIPFVGSTQVDLKSLACIFPNMGFLVVNDMHSAMA